MTSDTQDGEEGESEEQDDDLPQENELYEYTGMLDYPAGIYEVRGLRDEQRSVRMYRVRDGDENKISGEVHTVSMRDFDSDFESYEER